jgi:hypothetical protein
MKSLKKADVVLKKKKFDSECKSISSESESDIDFDNNNKKLVIKKTTFTPLHI